MSGRARGGGGRKEIDGMEGWTIKQATYLVTAYFPIFVVVYTK